MKICHKSVYNSIQYIRYSTFLGDVLNPNVPPAHQLPPASLPSYPRVRRPGEDPPQSLRPAAAAVAVAPAVAVVAAVAAPSAGEVVIAAAVVLVVGGGRATVLVAGVVVVVRLRQGGPVGRGSGVCFWSEEGGGYVKSLGIYLQ